MKRSVAYLLALSAAASCVLPPVELDPSLGSGGGGSGGGSGNLSHAGSSHSPSGGKSGSSSGGSTTPQGATGAEGGDAGGGQDGVASSGMTGLGGVSAGGTGAGGTGAGGTGAGGTGAGGTGAGGTGAGGTGAGGTGTGGTGDDPGKVVLFDGSLATFNEWVKQGGGNNPWTNNGDGSMTVSAYSGNIESKAKFNDVFVHLEYKAPMRIGLQERGSSGLYFKGSYEVQIRDSFGELPTMDSCGAIYGVNAPLQVACFDADVWNVYEIEFRAQACNGQGQKTADARFVEVTLNETPVQQNLDVSGATPGGQAESCEPRGMLLQDHMASRTVSFRNIWAIPR